MSKQANPAIVGGFVVGAVVLAIAGIMVFGGGKYFEKRLTYFLVFDGSVGGLNVGAPVKFRGVQVGEVTEVLALYDPAKAEIQIQVLIEVDPHSVQDVGEGGERTQRTFQEVKENIPRMVKRGLRATLKTQSFVTNRPTIRGSRASTRSFRRSLPAYRSSRKNSKRSPSRNSFRTCAMPSRVLMMWSALRKSWMRSDPSTRR